MVGVDLERAIAQLMRCELLSEAAVKEICEEVQKLLLSEANVIIVHPPVTIVGDLHGQFHDLLELFKVAGQCPDVNYLFLGNYVNRGYFSVETMSLITCLKLRYPERIHLLRGNHESRPVTRAYGFYGECMRKYGNTNVWRHFTDLFDFLPLAAVVNKEIFAVHAGIPPALTSIDQLRLVDRFKEVTDETFVVPLLWSVLNRQKEAAIQILRGGGGESYTFGAQEVNKFLKTNDLQHIVRSHELCMGGYHASFDNKLITIWSAPNYCYRCGNVAAVLEVFESMEMRPNVFLPSPDSESSKPLSDLTKEVPDYFSF